MFKFLFGLMWTAFVTPIFILCLVVPGAERGGADMDISLFIFFIIFEFIGLFMLISGLIQIIKDWKTKKHGTECYGIVRDIKTTGATVNERPEYKAIVDFINPETYETETLEEIIGFKYDKYHINSYLLCKYYQGDINIEETIPTSDIPLNIKDKLVPIQQSYSNHNIKFSADGEYVTIDGVEYKKIY